MAKQYVKRPIPIEVEQYDGENVPEFMGDNGIIDYVNRLCIDTPEGLVTCKKGDYVAKGVEGEFYPIRKDIFEKTYTPVSDDNNKGEHSEDLPITVDYDAEAVYIKLGDEPLEYTEEIIPCELNFDYNKYDEIVGIEILRNPVIKVISEKEEK